MSPLIVTEADFANLSLLDSPKLKRRLLAAVRLPSSAAPAHLVTMNSVVRCRDAATGERLEMQVVYPQDARSRSQDRCSVVSPLGLALLGASVGDTVEYGPAAARRPLAIEEVLHQPESRQPNYLGVRR